VQCCSACLLVAQKGQLRKPLLLIFDLKLSEDL